MCRTCKNHITSIRSSDDCNSFRIKTWLTLYPIQKCTNISNRILSQKTIVQTQITLPIAITTSHIRRDHCSTQSFGPQLYPLTKRRPGLRLRAAMNRYDNGLRFFTLFRINKSRYHSSIKAFI